MNAEDGAQAAPQAQTTQQATPAGTAAAAAQTQTQQARQEEEWQPERAKATIEKLRQFEKDARTLAKEKADLEAKLKAYEDEKLSESEKLQKRLAELETQNARLAQERKDALTRTALQEAAQAAGMKKASAIWKLADRDKLQFDEDGTPTPKSMEAAIAAVKAELPELFAQEQPQGQVGAWTPAAQPIPGGMPTNPAANRNSEVLPPNYIPRLDAPGLWKK